jgi:hypothetical protein
MEALQTEAYWQAHAAKRSIRPPRIIGCGYVKHATKPREKSPEALLIGADYLDWLKDPNFTDPPILHSPSDPVAFVNGRRTKITRNGLQGMKI